MKVKLLLPLFLLLLAQRSHAQNAPIYLNETLRLFTERELSDSLGNSHTDILPYTKSSFKKEIADLDYFRVKDKFARLAKRSLISLNAQSFHLNMDPFIDQQVMAGTNGGYLSGAGITIQTEIGKRFSGSLIASAWQGDLPAYLDSVVSLTRVVPGIGFTRTSGKQAVTSQTIGHITFSPNRYFDLTAGQGKYFLGDGNRSLLLSDNASPYPYASIRTKVWKFEYLSLYSWLRDIQNSTPFALNQRDKFATTHYLSWNVAKWFRFGFFESVVWESRDTTGGFGYDVNYLNPVLFFRPVEYSIGSPDNALMGANFKFIPFKKLWLYGQIAIDEFYLKFIRDRSGWWANKQGFQAGFKYFDAFTLKNLILQGEYNSVRPYTFSHGNPVQNYGHFGQPLAHPFGANFKELTGIAVYRVNRLFLEGKLSAVAIGLDTSAVNNGQNIFKSYQKRPQDFGNFTGQGLKTDLFWGEGRISYMIFPASRLGIFAGASLRRQSNLTGTVQNMFFTAGIKTMLFSNCYGF